MKRIWLAIVGLGLALAFPSGAQDAPPTELHKGDALLIHIEGVGGGLPAYREIVDSAGNIDLPFLGPLAADGKSLATLEAEISTAYTAAQLGDSPVVQITYITHFDPPPERSRLVRIQDPRQPATIAVEDPTAPAP